MYFLKDVCLPAFVPPKDHIFLFTLDTNLTQLFLFCVYVLLCYPLMM